MKAFVPVRVSLAGQSSYTNLRPPI